MTAIRLEQLQKSFKAGAPVLSRLSLSTEPGERIAIVGPSGAGKTTLLRLIAGFDQPDSGKIYLGEQDVTAVPPEKRDIAFVFQNLALYPHLTVEENLAFPLRLRSVPRLETAEQVRRVASLLRLDPFLTRRPVELSGGEAQRVALGRALIRKPAALLMDEPLSSLPPDLRLRLRHELIRLHDADRRPLLYVTHDHEEALALGERVAVLQAGTLQQFATPREIYQRPANRFVAGFVGRPAMNFVQISALKNEHIRVLAAFAGPTGGASTLGVRPEHLRVCEPREAWFHARVGSVQYAGGFSDLITRFEDFEIVARHFGEEPISVGEKLPLCARDEHAHFFNSLGDRLN